jgi:hypothetical protein
MQIKQNEEVKPLIVVTSIAQHLQETEKDQCHELEFVFRVDIDVQPMPLFCHLVIVVVVIIVVACECPTDQEVLAGSKDFVRQDYRLGLFLPAAFPGVRDDQKGNYRKQLLLFRSSKTEKNNDRDSGFKNRCSDKTTHCVRYTYSTLLITARIPALFAQNLVFSANFMSAPVFEFLWEGLTLLDSRLVR